MTIIDTYDNFTFTLMIVFLFIFLLSFIVLIMFNIKNSKKSNNGSNGSNLGQSSLYNNSSSPTLQCTPRQTLVGNVVQITC